MFAAGLHFWQLGDGQYWGHNAIIRVAPFMEHCGAAAAARASRRSAARSSATTSSRRRCSAARGWTLWLAYDLRGSYEEVPASLLEEMQRDRRWCQGNLQHLRLLFTEGLFGAHRALFLNGALLLRVGAALVRLPRRSARSRRCSWSLLRARLLPARPEPVPGVAGLAARLGACAARHRDRSCCFLPKLLAIGCSRCAQRRAAASAASSALAAQRAARDPRSRACSRRSAWSSTAASC